MAKVKPVKKGAKTRMSFAKIDEVMEMPNLIDVQINSYKWFLDKGLREVFRDIGEISDFNKKLSISFIDYSLGGKPKYSIKECKERNATYAAPLKVKTRLSNSETGEVMDSDIFMGDFPLMTPSGTFVINGAERVIISQLVRSPGAYYEMSRDKTGKELYATTVIPNRGAWLEYETDQNDVFYVRIDKTRKIPITTFIRALGIFLEPNVLDSDAQIDEFFGYDPRIKATLQKDDKHHTEEALLEVYRKLRPGEPPTIDSSKSYLETLFFDDHHYDITRVGRYKFNKKLGVSNRINGFVARDDIVNDDGELIAPAGTKITEELAKEIEQAGISVVWVKNDDKEVLVRGNGMVNIVPYLPAKYGFTDDELEDIGITDKVSYKELQKFLAEHNDADIEREDYKWDLEQNADILTPKHITIDDIIATISYLNNIGQGVGKLDDIDHLGNRRIRCVGELLQNQMRIGFTRMERAIRERMSIQNQDEEKVTAQALINIRPVVGAIREFFGSSPLSQFMDQTNPLSELTHKRRLSALGPGGLSRDRAGFEVRDVHYSHYGRMCPIETPEGPNIGLISSLATFARINKYGFIEAPYRKVDKSTGTVTKEVEYMTADVEDRYKVAQANTPLDENGKISTERVTVRYRDEFLEIPPDEVDYMDVSPKMVVSVATAMIPFLENDDANRALMGSNMQKQAVPLLKTEAPIVATGMEYKAAVDSGVAVIAREGCVVEKVDAENVHVLEDIRENPADPKSPVKEKADLSSGTGTRYTYELIKFMRSNQGTCINQRPVVNEGQRVEKGEVIADGPATSDGEISLGKNALIGFTTWEGYNYEDAVLLNEKLVRDDVYTSIHIAEYETEARDTKLGAEEITRDIPNVGEEALKDLDEHGIIRVGAEVHSGDILVGKVTPKGETDLTSEERLLRAIFGEKAREVRDTSLKVPHGEYGIVVNIQEFTRENSDELSPGVNKIVRVYIAQKRKISIGDKMSGRHGNKGVVSRILPQEDMPFLPDGTPLDILLNPLGVPSRMNIGQVLEVTMGLAARKLGWKIETPVFDGAHEEDIIEMLKQAGLDEDGKTVLYDGRTGEPFDNRVTVGIMYFLKLHHLVDDKIHARSTGPYSLVTQQPLGGKAQFGGQRFGEMEVWALMAYGATYTLQEILTVKSDDVVGRVKTYESIVKGENIPKPGIPEAFKVLIKELQALCLDVKVLDENNEEIDITQDYDDEGDVADPGFKDGAAPLDIDGADPDSGDNSDSDDDNSGDDEDQEESLDEEEPNAEELMKVDKEEENDESEKNIDDIFDMSGMLDDYGVDGDDLTSGYETKNYDDFGGDDGSDY